MKITYTGHAGLFIETRDCKILCDPWLHSNPAFFKSWYVYPPNEESVDWKMIEDEVTHLFVSHVHRDHFDEVYLEKLFTERPDLKVILPDYKYADLHQRFIDIGAEKFIEQGYHGVKQGETFFRIFVCETIDREREDSALLVIDNHQSFLNINDSKILPEHKEWIDTYLPSFQCGIDMMACQASGASYHPNSYDYDISVKKEKCDLHRDRTIERFMKIKEELDVKKSIVTAGPPIILDEHMTHLNHYGDNASVFHDHWQVKEFDEDDSIFRVLPGDTFTFDTIEDRPEGPDKERFIYENKKLNTYNILGDRDLYEMAKIMFLSKMNNIMKESTWLKKHIVEKLYLQVQGYDSFRFDFKNGVIVEERLNTTKMFYVITMPSRVFIEIQEDNITDWEEAFLSMRCTFERSPDKYNPMIVGFFRNLQIDKLNRIKDSVEDTSILNETFNLNGCEVQRYCPHQYYDLKHHGKVSEDGKELTCLGHGWTWSLQDGEGINTRSKICIKNQS